ncbi:MAG: ankyrin repeat domain-containing protein [Verrucomicrobiae bacterium]|nr:ankyrin repeat domain-containing protein [Verrucomicrobiae bacterium]
MKHFHMWFGVIRPLFLLVLVGTLFFWTGCKRPDDEVARGALEARGIRFEADPFVAAAETGDKAVVNLFVTAKMDLNVRDSKGWSPLAIAVLNGHTNIVNRLLEAGADPDILQDSGRQGFRMSVLTIAAQKDSLESARLLLEKGAKTGPYDATKWTPLHEAAQDGHVGMIQLLLKHKADPNAADDRGATPLRLAVESKDERAALMLLESGAKPDLATPEGETPLMVAANAGNEKIVSALLERGADPNLRYKQVQPGVPGGQTSLMAAVAKKRKAVVKKLLAAKADVHAADESGATPLRFACIVGDAEMAGILLEAGAKPDVLDQKGFSCLMSAIQGNHPGVVRVLLEKGADPNQKMEGDVDMMALAAFLGRDEIIPLLAAKGAKPDTFDSKKKSPLMSAAWEGRASTLKVLLAQGATLNLANADGETALMFAAYRGKDEAVRVLLEAGADASLRDRFGRDAAASARQGGFTGLAELLSQKNTKPAPAAYGEVPTPAKGPVEAVEGDPGKDRGRVGESINPASLKVTGILGTPGSGTVTLTLNKKTLIDVGESIQIEVGGVAYPLKLLSTAPGTATFESGGKKFELPLPQ